MRWPAVLGRGREPRLRLVAIASRATRLVWRAAPREFFWSVVFELLGAVALAMTLLFGRDVVVRLTAASGDFGISDVLPAVIGLGVALIVSGVAQVLVAEKRVLIGEKTVRETQDEIIQIATSVRYERFESQTFNDLLERANTRASQSAFQIVSDLLGLVNVVATSMAVVLVLVGSVPAVLPALALVAIPFAIAARATALLAFQVSYDLTPHDRLRSYLYGALVGKPAAKEVRVFAIARPLHDRWRELAGERLTKLSVLARRRTLYNGAAAIAVAALVATVVIVLVDAAAADRISLADAAIAIVALQQLSARIRRATSTTGSLRSSALYLNDFDTFRAARGEGIPPLAPAALEPAELCVDGVSFRYPGTDPMVLHDVSLTIAPGEIVALVGVSGSGKTTLANLVAGLYEPTSGQIRYGGRDITEIDQAVYRRSLAVVFQDFVRYEVSARENIAMSDRSRLDDLDGVADAARRAGIAPALERLAGGYETRLSRGYEGGADLSVGQWQRVAVARAFFRDAPLLVLDEPAAALDVRAEQELFDRLTELVQDRSVLMISHRFSSVRLAHRILVMSDGHITESGTHQELLERDGLYADLFAMQAKGYLPVTD